MTAIDPLTLSVVRGSLEHITEEMDLTLKRTAFSPVISEGNDLANGFYHRDTGEVIVQGKWGLAIFIGVMQFTCEAVIAEAERRGVEEGDVFLVNDPYSGGTHLMDMGMVKPFYYRGQRLLWMANRGHWPDMGGMVPGGFGATSTEIYQEGLRIPPVKLFKQGELNEDVLIILMTNIRVAEERYGDFKAHLAAFSVGERRLTALLERYGVDTVLACMDELKRRSERQMRSYLAEIPDGTYTYEDFLDSDGVVNEPLRIHLALTIAGSDARLDFSQSSPPCKGPMNSVISTTKSACYLGFKHIFPDIPVNSGCFAPLHIHAPESTFLNAVLPRPVAGCAAEVSQRVADVVMGALGRAAPERAQAGIFGTVNNCTLGGIDPERGPYVAYMFNGGGYGGFEGGDGLNYGSPVISVARSQPAELYEQRYPVRIRRFALRDDSGGAGKYRGGLGAEIELEFLGEEGTLSFIADRGRFGPKGLSGGGEGAKTVLEVLDGETRYVPPHITKDANLPLRKGTRFRQATPGGGGFGNPLERDPAAVADDVRNEYVSPQSAREVYGVVLKGAPKDGTLKVDEKATEALRGRKKLKAAGD
ncbi:MAG: hydantoinase B/oxoprolinase family protein [SAR324 cluster bacterium]|nr:hydantoinase B/oxoprolinase family protein [SAR324 cluster bacterium]